MPFDTPEKRSELFAQLGNQRWKDFENGSPEYLPSFPETPAEEVPEGLAPVSAEFLQLLWLKNVVIIQMPEAVLQPPVCWP